MDTSAVQRHRNTILDCLRDGDISIRRRALELSYALINEQNVRVLVRELLAFLEVADDEFKTGMTTQISLAAERFAPNKRWHIDTVLRSLKLVRTTAQDWWFILTIIRPEILLERRYYQRSSVLLHIHLSCRPTPHPNCTPRSKPTSRKSHSPLPQFGSLVNIARFFSKAASLTKSSPKT